MKLEKTAKCFKEAKIRRGDEDPDKSELEFHPRREYQVDIFATVKSSHYRVYQNGGWNDYTPLLTDEEFSEYFILIE